MSNLQPAAKKFLVVLAGPTASGKTALSIDIARPLNAEIISADARQFYRGLTIGTAKPTPEQLSAVPHHFIDSRSVLEPYSAGAFAADAQRLISILFQRMQVVVVVGGSGLYLQALVFGLDAFPPVPENVRRQVQRLYEEEGLEGLWHQLKERDPEYLASADRQNHARLKRALAVSLVADVPYSSLRKNKKVEHSCSVITIGLQIHREEVYRRIDSRVDEMMARGLADEARALLPYRNLDALNTVGYQELFRHFDGRITLEEAVAEIKKNTRHYARRQMTWFRKFPGITWFHPQEVPAILDFIKGEMQRITG